MKKYWVFILNNIDTILAISLSIVAAIFGIFGVMNEALLPAIATTLALLATSIIRDRSARETLQSKIQKLDSTLNALGSKPNADAFFQRSNVEFDRQILYLATEEIWLIQETGSLLLEQPGKLREFIKSGGVVKVILVSMEKNVVEELALRNPDVKNYTAMSSRQNDAAMRIEMLKSEIINASGRLEIRRINYPLDLTSVLADPEAMDTSKRKGMVRLAGFRTPFTEKRQFPITFTEEPETYLYFVNQFKHMWENSN